MTKKLLPIISIWFFLLCNTVAGQVTYKQYMARMDSTWEKNNDPAVEFIIGYYKPKMDMLMQEVIGVSEFEMSSGRPESLLSNFTTDAMLVEAEKISSRDIDFSLTNFGGLRTVLPEGEVRRYDIFSIYPFENYMVIVDLPGIAVRNMFESFARRRVEAFSHNVKMEIEGGYLKSLQINGEQIEDEKVYHIATIDFLLTGGDNMVGLQDATNIEQTGVLLRDVIINHIESITKEGKLISSHIDNRVIQN